MAKRSKTSVHDWNIPDWKKPELYPVPLHKDDSDNAMWRWEFLRRDETYRQDWLRFRALKHPFELALEDDPSDIGYDVPMYPDEYEERHGHIFYALWKHKIGRLLNPAHRYPIHLKFYPIPTDGVLVWFDLTMSVPEQLQHAENFLNKYQEQARGVRVRGTLPDKNKWPKFLRALDAHAEGASLAEVGKYLWDMPTDDADKRNQAITNANSRLQKARTFWRKIPIPREVPEYDGKLLRGEDLMDLFPPYLPRTGDDIDRVLPPKMPRVTLPL
jgi:hypothetical protein